MLKAVPTLTIFTAPEIPVPEILLSRPVTELEALVLTGQLNHMLHDRLAGTQHDKSPGIPGPVRTLDFTACQSGHSLSNPAQPVKELLVGVQQGKAASVPVHQLAPRYYNLSKSAQPVRSWYCLAEREHLVGCPRKICGQVEEVGEVLVHSDIAVDHEHGVILIHAPHTQLHPVERKARIIMVGEVQIVHLVVLGECPVQDHL